MSCNIRSLSYREEMANNLFECLNEAARGAGTPSNEALKKLADDTLLSPAVTFGSSSFYDYLGTQNEGQNVWHCQGMACLVVRNGAKGNAEGEKSLYVGYCYSGEGVPKKDQTGRFTSHHFDGTSDTQPAMPIYSCATVPVLTSETESIRELDNEFTEQCTDGYDEFKNKIMAQKVDELERLTDVTYALVEKAALLYGRTKAAMAFHGLGVTEHYQGSRTVILLADIAMMTGNIGRPGTGVNPLRGQNNVQGAADMGVQPHQGAGYLDVTDELVLEKYKDHYGVEVPAGKGLKIPEMFGAARDGKLKALWIIGEDSMQTDPNSGEVKYSLSRLDLLIVQELFMTETCSMADVVLPASSFLEKKALSPRVIAGCKGSMLRSVRAREPYPMDRSSAT